MRPFLSRTVPCWYVYWTATVRTSSQTSSTQLLRRRLHASISSDLLVIGSGALQGRCIVLSHGRLIRSSFTSPTLRSGLFNIRNLTWSCTYMCACVYSCIRRRCMRRLCRKQPQQVAVRQVPSDRLVWIKHAELLTCDNMVYVSLTATVAACSFPLDSDTTYTF